MCDSHCVILEMIKTKCNYIARVPSQLKRENETHFDFQFYISCEYLIAACFHQWQHNQYDQGGIEEPCSRQIAPKFYPCDWYSTLEGSNLGKVQFTTLRMENKPDQLSVVLSAIYIQYAVDFFCRMLGRLNSRRSIWKCSSIENKGSEIQQSL